MLRKLFGLAVLSLLLVLTLCVSAQAAETQEISGEVKASDLIDGTTITLTGDTVLTLDADRSVERLNANTGGSGSAPTLTLRGEKTLTVRLFMSCNVVMESGVLEAGYLRCDSMTINGGEVRADVDLLLVEEGEEGAGNYSMPLCFGLDSLTVNDGTLSIDGKTSGLNNGLGADKINISSGSIDVRNCTYVAICTGDMTVSGGEVHASAEGTGICEFNSVSNIEKLVGLTVQGGRVEAVGTWPGTTSEDGYSVGVGMPKVTVSGGTLIASGSVSAINSDEPIQLGENVMVRTPEGGYASTEPMLLEPSVSQRNPNGWSGYSILNADGTRATTAVLSAPVEAAATGTMGEKEELTWSYYEGSGAVTVEGEGISEATPVIVASYDGNGKMLSVSMVTASGDSAKADDEAEGVRLFWLNSEGGPQCGSETVKEPNSFSGK